MLYVFVCVCVCVFRLLDQCSLKSSILSNGSQLLCMVMWYGFTLYTLCHHLLTIIYSNDMTYHINAIVHYVSYYNIYPHRSRSFSTYNHFVKSYVQYVYLYECVPSLSIIYWTISVEFFFYFHVCPLYVTWGTSFRPTLFGEVKII